MEGGLTIGFDPLNIDWTSGLHPLAHHWPAEVCWWHLVFARPFRTASVTAGSPVTSAVS